MKKTIKQPSPPSRAVSDLAFSAILYFINDLQSLEYYKIYLILPPDHSNIYS